MPRLTVTVTEDERATPDSATAPASEAGIDAAPDEAAAPSDVDSDHIPQWGRRRDLSTHEVRQIVRRCKKYQAAGGSIAKFHDQESRQWPDPDDSPRAYSKKTLETWTRDARFQ